MNAGIGYRFADFQGLKQPEIRANFFNILDSLDLVGVNGIQNNALETFSTDGRRVTTVVNNANQAAVGTPSYFLGQPFSFLITLRAGL
jgi:hypothetical protein